MNLASPRETLERSAAAIRIGFDGLRVVEQILDAGLAQSRSLGTNSVLDQSIFAKRNDELEIAVWKRNVTL